MQGRLPPAKGLTTFFWGYIGVILSLYWDSGKENGNYYRVEVYHSLRILPPNNGESNGKGDGK